MDWNRLLNESRRRPKAAADAARPPPQREFRRELERDYDRILFSAPVRRLADKTQVFPLERNDSVRNRLTHSHEVSNLCRSLGTHLASADPMLSGDANHRRDVPALLAAVGLAHDLGNPPFGHQGEVAIQAWFEKRKVLQGRGLTPSQVQDFTKFEGNAQTLRVLTKLQLRTDEYGLNLTYATLAAVMKYPTSSDAIDSSRVSTKKHGYFQSEANIVQDVWDHTGLAAGQRHPLTYLMEACDDIAYTVLDAEDAVKKGLVSFSDLIAYLKHRANGDRVIEHVAARAVTDHAEHQNFKLSPAELNDLSMLMFRVHAIGAMIPAVYATFDAEKERIEQGAVAQDLLSLSSAARLRSVLHEFNFSHAYQHKTVLALEAEGFRTIATLMDLLWKAIVTRKSIDEPASPRTTPFAKYAYARISENYRRVFEDAANNMPMRYKEAQLLTDMISGMTDSFAVDLCKDLERYDYEAETGEAAETGE
jgi:dGTPase